LTAVHPAHSPVNTVNTVGTVHSGPGSVGIGAPRLVEHRPAPSTVQRTEFRDSYPAPSLTLSGGAPATPTPHTTQVRLPEAPPVTVVAQREVAQPDPTDPEPPPAASPAAPGPTPEPAPTSAAATAAPPPAAGGDPEELVKKLFDPLLRRLKTELWLDRERRGRLTDLRP
jgi:hypothetical protein